MNATRNDIPPISPEVQDRPTYAALTPDAEEAFLRKQTEFEAAYRRTGDPLVLSEALMHAWWSRQTVPGWLVSLIADVMLRNRTDDEAKRYRERLRHVRRYCVVQRLRDRGFVKHRAVERTLLMLEGEDASGAYETVEDSYDMVRKDLDRLGQESEYFLLVEQGRGDRAANGQEG